MKCYKQRLEDVEAGFIEEAFAPLKRSLQAGK